MFNILQLLFPMLLNLFFKWLKAFSLIGAAAGAGAGEKTGAGQNRTVFATLTKRKVQYKAVVNV